MIAISVPRASKVFNVSSRDSPLVSEDLATEKFTTSPLSLLAAISNEILVRVEFSKNKFVKILLSKILGKLFFDLICLEKNRDFSTRE